MTRRGNTRRYPRTARVNEVVREVLAEDLERMSDPRLEVVTITGVEMSSDVRYAEVYYSTLGTPEQAEAAAAALMSVTGRLRAMLGREVRLRYTPELRWHVDPAIAQGARIEEVIRSLHDGDADHGPDETRR